jgi:hypothetical protein
MRLRVASCLPASPTGGGTFSHKLSRSLVAGSPTSGKYYGSDLDPGMVIGENRKIDRAAVLIFLDTKVMWQIAAILRMNGGRLATRNPGRPRHHGSRTYPPVGFLNRLG